MSLAVVLDRLDTLTGGDWDADLHQCGPPLSQKVGFIWNSDRVTLSNFSDEEQLNGRFDGGSACAGNLRPGRYARVTTGDDGVDFHILSVHLDSERQDRDFTSRRNAIDEIDDLEIAGQPLAEIGEGGDGDNDILIIGDWNTMGWAVRIR